MRKSGILMHISSLPSPYGIGTLGKEAYRFVDFLRETGQSYWQVLPIGQTGFGDSPYQSFSTYAGNPYFIDLDTLYEWGLLDNTGCRKINWGDNAEKVDFGLLYGTRYSLLQGAVENFLTTASCSCQHDRNQLEDRLSYDDFCKQEGWWLNDYALFMALKEQQIGAPWHDWQVNLKRRNSCALDAAKQKLESKITFWKVIQYWFFVQWGQLKKYANDNGIGIIGDIPIYTAQDSADVWANPEQFQLDEDLEPIEVAGCPPDGFSELGQLWGNPLFNWDFMEESNYSWWSNRIHHATQLFDVIRIDHFRGFDTYYAIPKNMPDARSGRWRRGPGIDFFRQIERQNGKLSIIAEDLGLLFDSVRQLVKESGYPGMKVLQFAFDESRDSEYLPHKYPKTCVVYTGTHDNDTILGWVEHAAKKEVDFAKIYLGLSADEGYNWGMIRGALASAGDLVILTMQDVLGLPGWARMNTPATLVGNWTWRMKDDAITPEVVEKLKEYTKIYGRANAD